MTSSTFSITQGSREAATIRAAYEILMGFLGSDSIPKELDLVVVRKIAERLNDLLPGCEAEPIVGIERAKTIGALWMIEQSRRLRLIDASDKGTARVEVYLADLRALMQVQVPCAQ
jgi:hypothetical protein